MLEFFFFSTQYKCAGVAATPYFEISGPIPVALSFSKNFTTNRPVSAKLVNEGISSLISLDTLGLYLSLQSPTMKASLYF